MRRFRPKSSARTPRVPRIPTRRQQQIDELVERFREELEERFGSSDEIMTIDEIEGAACDIRDNVGQAVAQEITQAEADAAEAQENEKAVQKEACQKCSRIRQYRASQTRTVVTMAGDVVVRRRVYHCRRCKQCTMPVDYRLRLPEHRYTSQVERWVAQLCVKDTFERSMRELLELGRVQVSAKEAQRICLEMGSYAQKEMRGDRERVLPRNPTCVHLRGRNPEGLGPQHHDPSMTGYISMDGVMVPRDRREHGKHENHGEHEKILTEAKLGHVELVQETPGREEPGKTLKSLHCFHLGGPDECAEQTYALACRAGVTELSRLVVVADGAEWIWKRAAQYFPDATQILDWYHAVEHVAEVVRHCVSAEMMASSQAGKRGRPEKCPTETNDQPRIQPIHAMQRKNSGDGENCGHVMSGQPLNEHLNEHFNEQQLKSECDRRLKPLKDLMWNGDVPKLLAGISELPQVNEEAATKVKAAVGYFRGQAKRMRYDQYREKGFRVGSGAMESACKQVVSTRMKGAGMRWSEAGAQAIGHLRALYLSTDRWSEVIGSWQGRRLVAVPLC